MKTYRLILNAGLAACILAILGFFALGPGPALSQEDMKEIKAEAFGKHSRLPALFVHDAHNEKAGIEECETCHHGKDDQGRQDPSDMSAGTPCAECHAVDARGSTPLMRAYHQQCITCHTQKDVGPTHCGGCHKAQ